MIHENREQEHDHARDGARQIVEKGMITSVLGGSRKAIATYTRALEIDRDCVEALLPRAMEHLLAHESPKARRDLQRARAQAPGSLPLRLGFAALLRHEGRHRQAGKEVEDIDLCGLSDPLDPEPLGLVHVLDGRPLEALGFFARAGIRDPRRLSSISGIGWCAFAQALER